MKVAVFGESGLDEEAVRTLVDGLVNKSTQAVEFRLRSRGWSGVKDNLPAVLTHLHYRTDAEALVVIADSDDSPLHQVGHEQPGNLDRECRQCILLATIDRTLERLNPVAGRATIKIAAGIAVPAIEAWFLCGHDSRASEAAWLQGGPSMRGADYRKKLKRTLYGEDFAPQAVRVRRLREESLRLAQDLSLLESHFPAGFGLLARAIRSW